MQPLLSVPPFLKMTGFVPSVQPGYNVTNHLQRCSLRGCGLPRTYLRGPRKRRAAQCMCGESTAPSEDQSVSSLIRSEDFVERIRGVNRAGEISVMAERLEALLPIASSDPNGQVRFCALSQLAALERGGMGEEDASAILETVRYIMAHEKESSCLAGAADVIAGLKLKDGFEDLVKAFRETTDWMLKFTIAAGMGELAHPDAYAFLTEILNTKEQDSLLYTAAIGALGDLGDKRAIPLIEEFKQSEDGAVKERANIALSMLAEG